MFVKIGSGIFASEDIRVIIFEEDAMTVHLKNVGENEDDSYSVEKSPSDNSALDSLVATLNVKASGDSKE